MDQRGVIAAFHVDLRLFSDAVIDDSIQRVAIANWGNSAADAVPEQLSDLVFAGQADIITELHSQVRKLDVARCRKDREHVATIAAQNDAFSQTVA